MLIYELQNIKLSFFSKYILINVKIHITEKATVK